MVNDVGLLKYLEDSIIELQSNKQKTLHARELESDETIINFYNTRIKIYDHVIYNTNQSIHFLKSIQEIQNVIKK